MASSDDVTENGRSDEIFIGCVHLIACIIGVVSNWSVVFFFRYVSSFRSVFGIFSAHQAFSEGTYCLVELVYMVPMMLSGNYTLKYYSYHCGFLMYVCYDLSAQSHFLISTNRFCAVYFPHKYNSLFSLKTTSVMLSIVWIIMLTTSITVFQFFGCEMHYLNTVWLYTRTVECQNMTFIIDFLFHITLVSLMIVMNTLTLIRFKQRNKSLQHTIDKASSARKQKSESNFLKQMFFQGSAYVFALLSFFFIAKFVTGKWLKFFIVILPWIVVHAFDGSVTILCSPELRQVCIEKYKSCFTSSKSEITLVKNNNSDGNKTTHIF